MTPCQENGCNQPIGHEPPHGLEAAPGLVFAPFGGTQVGPEEVVPVSCDMCRSGVMRMTRFSEGGGLFRCSCGQDFRITSTSVTSLKVTLFPSRRGEPDLEHQRADGWARREILIATAKRYCGLTTVEEWDETLGHIHAEVARYKAKHPKVSSPKRRSWWPWARV